MKDSSGIFNDFFSILEREYDSGNPFLDSDGYRLFKRYYRRSFNNKLRRALYKKSYYSRLHYMINLLFNSRNPIILDAGCGLGSESIFFSSLGAKVVGVDIKENMVKVAEKRKLFYRDLIRRKVEFVLGNVFEVIKKQKFDIIWMNEAISHIHPAEGFLKLAHRQLNPGGRVIISEGNADNPCIRVRQVIQTGHWSWDAYFVQDPRTGKKVGYTTERMFSLEQIGSILKRAGYSIGRVELTHFTILFFKRYRIINEIMRGLEQWLDKQEFRRFLALSYRIEGKAD